MLIGIDANEANVANRVGSNQYAFKLLEQLNKLDQKNSYLIYLKKSPLTDLPKPSENWQYRIIKKMPLWTQWRLPLSLYLKKPRPDVFLTLGHYAPRFSPVPRLICILDLAYLFFPKTYLRKDLYKLKRWTARSVKRASHIFTISKATKKDIQKHYQVKPDKITVAYPAIDHQRFIKKSPSPVKGEYLLYLGTLQPRKNLIELVKAYADLPEEHQSNKLVIAGKKGWLYKPLFKLVKDLDLESRVIFTGFVKNVSLSGLIQNAKLLILPSLYEGFGIPVVQSMAAGTPVLVSKNSSLKEIVSSFGLYIKPPFKAKQIKAGILKALLVSSEKKQSIIKQAQARSQQFSWKKSTTKILHALNQFE